MKKVRLYDIGGSHALKDDTVLPEGSVLHSGVAGPSIAYVFISEAGERHLTIAVRGPFAVGKLPGTSDHAYFLRPSNGKVTND